MSTPWPTTPTPVAWHLGKSLALVWIDEHGQRWVAHRFGEPVVGEDDKLHPDTRREPLGAPLGWREAAARLPKDCGCIAHEGPCWIHTDLMDRESNAALLWPVRNEGDGNLMAFLAFGREEGLRLRRLLDDMKVANVTNLNEFLGLSEGGQHAG